MNHATRFADELATSLAIDENRDLSFSPKPLRDCDDGLSQADIKITPANPYIGAMQEPVSCRGAMQCLSAIKRTDLSAESRNFFDLHMGHTQRVIHYQAEDGASEPHRCDFEVME